MNKIEFLKIQKRALDDCISHYEDVKKIITDNLGKPYVAENFKIYTPSGIFLFGIGGDYCECCNQFFCDDCPICQYTGNKNCIGTPYNNILKKIVLSFSDNFNALQYSAVDDEIRYLENIAEKLLEKLNDILIKSEDVKI